ncbi:MAG: Plug domain-containing protein, partial [Flavobacteriaceae bacterium]|nr:Plug domain-containing protein [Flavobacteriaceae bacterium]
MSSFHKTLILTLLLSPIYLLAQTEKDSITQVFQLGEVVIQTSPQKNQVKTDEIIRFNKKDVAETLDLLPSISMNTVGGRNESSVYLRGFDIRSIPIYLDGIPVYVPYDGYADLSRFTTADLAKIEVSKG